MTPAGAPPAAVIEGPDAFAAATVPSLSRRRRLSFGDRRRPPGRPFAVIFVLGHNRHVALARS
jgi:hypothetical protein